MILCKINNKLQNNLFITLYLLFLYLKYDLFKQSVYSQLLSSQYSMYKQTLAHTRSGKHLHSTFDQDGDLRDENSRLKKQLKELTAQRNLTIKQCTQLSSKVDNLEQQLLISNKKHKQQMGRNSNEGYRIEQLHFLNKQLNNEIEQLRSENRDLLEKYKRSTGVVEMKYEELERNTFKKIELAMKRVKKAVMYLTTLSGKEIEKTRDSMVENLEKSLELLKGKHLGETYEEEVEELMSPIASIKQELVRKEKELRATKAQLLEVQQSHFREEKMNKNILPQYKASIEELQKNLSISRAQVAELELDKLEYRRRCELKIKQLEDQNKDLIASFTKLKLQRKLYSDRIKEIEGYAEQEKERLLDENQLLKNLYKAKSNQNKHITTQSSNLEPPQRQNIGLKASKSRHSSRSKLSESQYSHKYSEKDSSLMSSVYRESQRSLKNEIDEINREIEEIQNNIEKEMNGSSR